MSEQQEPAPGTGTSSRGVLRDHPPVDAVEGIVAAFEKHPVVIIAEWRHGLRQMGDFYVTLVYDKRFQAINPDIVIEFASHNNQHLLDQYINGEDIAPEKLRQIWRDTTKVGAWEFPIYAEWLAAIRELNQKLPPARRLHVLAGDTAVDWTKINSHADWEALGDNNISFADVIMNQVLKQGRKAFVVLGGNHVGKLGTRTGSPNVTTLVEASYPDSVYAILHYLDPKNPAESLLRMPDPTVATLYDLKGTSFGESPDANGVPPIQYTDALLYVGPIGSMTESKPPAGSFDAVFMKEIDRRSMIEWGELRARKAFGAAVK